MNKNKYTKQVHTVLLRGTTTIVFVHFVGRRESCIKEKRNDKIKASQQRYIASHINLIQESGTVKSN